MQDVHTFLANLGINEQEPPAAHIGPPRCRLDWRNIDAISAAFWWKRNIEFNLSGAARGGRVWQMNPGAFQDEQVRIRIEELPSDGKCLGLPFSRRAVFEMHMDCERMATLVDIETPVHGTHTARPLYSQSG